MPVQQFVLQIDPGGTPPVRSTGINLTAAPIEPPTLTVDPVVDNGITFVGQQATSQFPARMSFTVPFYLDTDGHQTLDALVRWQQQNYGRYEVVLYYLWDTITDIGTQKRQNVPGTTPVTVGTGNSARVTYFPVVQGFLGATFQRRSGCLVRCDLTFVEGTILTPAPGT